ncbi:MAG: helix-turn-helix domain-containing protein [Rhodopseudomonas palustris]|nr:helix-turn-helix domain-containing protein [Rhodopseudomonas palustris]
MDGTVVTCRFFKDLHRFIENKPYALMRNDEFATRELGQALDQMLLLGRRSAEEKVAAFLVSWRDRLARVEGVTKTVTLLMGRQDMDFLGLTIETVSRTFTKLEREKPIVIVPDGVRVLDPKRFDALRRLGAFEHTQPSRLLKATNMSEGRAFHAEARHYLYEILESAPQGSRAAIIVNRGIALLLIVSIATTVLEFGAAIAGQLWHAVQVGGYGQSRRLQRRVLRSGLDRS